MVQAPSISSSQASINVSLPSSSSNPMVSILDASGNTILHLHQVRLINQW